MSESARIGFKSIDEAYSISAPYPKR